MPSTVNDLLTAASLTHDGVVRWGTRVPLAAPGVYLIATAESPNTLVTHDVCPVSDSAVQTLLQRRPELLVDDVRPSHEQLRARLASMWLADETVLYVGLAGTSIAQRVRQYYRTPLGARKPHAGGWPLKTLSLLDGVWVHYAACSAVDDAERGMATSFMAGVSPTTRTLLHDPAYPLPFANLTVPNGPRKKHGITGATEAR